MKSKHLAACLLIIALAVLMFVTGCASKPKPSPQFSAPSASKVAASIRTVKESLTVAKTKAAEVQAVNDTPLVRELVSAIESANAEATRTQVEMASYTQNVAIQTDLLNKTVTEKNEGLIREEVMQTKIGKQSRENWFWRSLAAAIVGTVLVWLGFKFGWKIL